MTKGWKIFTGSIIVILIVVGSVYFYRKNKKSKIIADIIKRDDPDKEAINILNEASLKEVETFFINKSYVDAEGYIQFLKNTKGVIISNQQVGK